MSNFNFGKVENNPQTSAAEIAPAIEMGISNAPTRLIVKYITDMYSYPLEAAIRETISNAIDAATAAGHGLEGVHAEVNGEYGSYEDGEFCVRDNGAGMSNEKLINVYTQYGVSDKRDDEDATGAFGLGAKSPLAYINEFHIITKTVDEGCRYVHMEGHTSRAVYPQYDTYDLIVIECLDQQSFQSECLPGIQRAFHVDDGDAVRR